MTEQTAMLQTKLTPPRLHRRLLTRPGVVTKLSDAFDYRLTLVHASTGYGKSTALAALADQRHDVRWYSLDQHDSDPARFLMYLVAACQTQIDADDLPTLEPPLGDGEQRLALCLHGLDRLINALATHLTEPMLLVLDDYHLVGQSPAIQPLVQRLIDYAPHHLHLAIASRYPLDFAGMLRWRAKGDVLEIDRDDLVFRPAEIAVLFRDVYGVNLSSADVAHVAAKTEGWPIALHLVWQALQRDATRNVADVLAQGPTALSALFSYLAADVLAHQPEPVQQFLRDTAVLPTLTPAACDAVRCASDSATLLHNLHERDLFVVEIGEQQYRYHHLIHDFLRQQAAEDGLYLRQQHQRAAHFFADQSNPEAAIEHWLAARAYDHAAATIAQFGPTMLRLGRLDTLQHWIEALPPEQVRSNPTVLLLHGDIHRLRSRFDEALALYTQAQQHWFDRQEPAAVSAALQRQALVYIDQVRPLQAEQALHAALQHSDARHDPAGRAELLVLLAENKLNMGHASEAEVLRTEAHTLLNQADTEDLLSVRIKLRTGQLPAARAILEQWVATERQQMERGVDHSPRGHRESMLILSLVLACCGEAQTALQLATEGIAIGERVGAPFITSVGHMRSGHALQVQAHRSADDDLHAAAIRHYHQALALADQLAVQRLRAEPQWGLTRAYGFWGDLAAAERTAQAGIAICCAAGDRWVGALIRLALGASYVLADAGPRALATLHEALTTFEACSDTFGQAAATLWLSLAHHQRRDELAALRALNQTLALCETHDYLALLTRPTLLGPPNSRMSVPLLVAARAGGHAYAGRVLATLGLADVAVHPGYQLRVQTLGAFRVWRGATEIEPREWQRAQARQIFQLLLTRRDHWVQRDEIIDVLWPDAEPQAAARTFKVALNALNKALEPQRTPDQPFAYIIRDGTAYRLRPDADVWLDCAAFETASISGQRSLETGDADRAQTELRSALALYAGAYLPDALYEAWASVERERLGMVFLRSADRLAQVLLTTQQHDEAIAVCLRILAIDPCWENAYQILMQAHAQQGNRSLALRTYQRCVDVLEQELGIEPDIATSAVYDHIRDGHVLAQR